MKTLLIRGGLAAAALGLVLIAGAAVQPQTASGISYSTLNPIQKRLVSGALAETLGFSSAGASGIRSAATRSTCVNPTGGGDEGDEADNECAPDALSPVSPGSGGGGDPNFSPSGPGGCSESLGDNVKVNQACENVSDAALAGRGQAQNEEAVAINPMDPSQMVASQNDYRRGDGNCIGAFTGDGGRSWTDSLVPMSFTYGSPTWGTARQYWQAGGDTSVAWDTKGNAYMSCQMFNRGSSVSPNPDQSSAFYIFRSTGNGGASWNFPAVPTTEFADTAGAGTVLEDKAYMTVDDHVGSPFQDRIYVTWTEFAADGSAYIYEVHSSDYGKTFSQRALVSKTSSLCTVTFGAGTSQGTCNENQFSNPFVGPDGVLYVAYDNFNNSVTGKDNRNQVLLTKSTDGGASFSSPVKVSDYYDLPDCLTYQSSDPFRACVPEKGPSTNSVFRATNYPVGSVNPKNPKQVVVTVGSYINKDSNETNGCTPDGFSADTGLNLYTGAKDGSCNNDILISVSNDAGGTFTGTTADPRDEATVNPDPDQATTDQFWQWQVFNKDGKLAVDYYDRQYGKTVNVSPSGPAGAGPGKSKPAGIPSDEYYGNSDITLSGSKDLNKWGTTRVTSSSMPPPTQFGGQFYGDYIGMDASDRAVPIWSDTRDPELFDCGTTPPAICTGSFSTAQGPLLANDENSYAAVERIPTK